MLDLSRAAVAVLLAVACAGFGPPAEQGSSSATTLAPAPPLFDRVTVIGASVSDGFGVVIRSDGTDSPRAEQAAAVDLADILLAACPDGSCVIHSYATNWVFTNPPEICRGQVERALKNDPTLILAIDFLFWHAYGALNRNSEALTSEDQRLELLELGLSRLDEFTAKGIPLVVGDLPDMQEAVGKMISANQVPKPETIAKLNARIAQWAATKSKVILLPLSSFSEKLRKGEPVEASGKTWSSATHGPLLQRDQLHLTLNGSIAMVAAAIDAARALDPQAPFQWNFDVPAVLQRLREKKLDASVANAPTPVPAATGSSPAGP